MVPTSAILERFHGDRCELIPALQAVQEVQGFLSLEAVREISRKLRITENEIHGVATFYAQFRFDPPGRHHVKVCLGTACHVSGAVNLMEVMEADHGLQHSQTSEDGELSLERVACLGCCALAPVVVVDDEVHGRMNRVKFTAILDAVTGVVDADEHRSGPEAAKGSARAHQGTKWPDGS